MKKRYLLFLILALVLGLCSCANVPANPEFTPPVSQSPTATVPTAPESPSPEVTPSPEVSPPVETTPIRFIAPAGTVVYNVDISRMIYEDAYAALTKAAEGYTHSVLIGEKELTFSAQDVALTLDETQFTAFWENLKAGHESYSNLFSLDSSALEQVLSAQLEFSAKDPSVVYSRDQQKFVVTPGSDGMDYDIPSIASFVAPCVCSLYASSSMNGFGRETAPSVSDDDPRLAAAVDSASRYLTADLTYTFTPEGGQSASVQLDEATIASFIRISNDFGVSLNSSAISQYAASLGKQYSAPDYTGDFRTTSGSTAAYAVTYRGQQVDCDALTADLYNCLSTGISGIREAVYLPVEALPFGGSYVEVDLTAQTLWVYKNGQCVVSTPIVSGCVADGSSTPTGVFSIYKKAEDAWLAGPTWKDFVDYWMPFYGAYGLHDASWRSEFGGEIYIHEGSHGCPNLPVEVAGQVYQNVSVGTPVIVHGGLTEAVDLTQEITGTTVYELAESGRSFPLELTLKYPEAEIAYTSDNLDVATVSPDGIVTIHGEGIANITVSAAAFTYHTGATVTVQIRVSFPEDSTEHLYGQWTQTAAPGCETAGSESRTCSLCGRIESREVPATGHDFSAGALTCANGCGTANPHIIWPNR